MKYYYEYCDKVFSRIGYLTDDFKNRHGFRGVYGFSKEDANSIKASGNSQGFEKYAQYSDIMICDMDDGEASVGKLTSFLDGEGYAYRLYSSGGKGYHVEILCNPMYSLNTAYSQLQTAKELAELTGATIDMSIYRPSSLYRLEGTIHQKTGKTKILIKEIHGVLLDIVEAERPVTPNIQLNDTKTYLKPFLRLVTIEEPLPGERHVLVWSLARNFREAGLDLGTTLDILWGLNNTWQSKKSHEEVKRSVVQAYQQM